MHQIGVVCHLSEFTAPPPPSSPHTHSLARSTQASRITTRTGSDFRGITCSAPIVCSRELQSFDPRGFRERTSSCGDGGRPHFNAPANSDIVCIESEPDDEMGCHAAVVTDNDSRGIFPPNTLYTLKEVKQPGEWTAPGGVRVQQRLIVVRPTYRPPRGLGAYSAGSA